MNEEASFPLEGEGPTDLWVLSDGGGSSGVAPDGRFLIETVLDDAAAPITLLQNWHPEAKK